MSDEDVEKLKYIAESFFNTSKKLMGEALRKLIDEKYQSLKKQKKIKFLEGN